jgi:hypothetical protein
VTLIKFFKNKLFYAQKQGKFSDFEKLDCLAIRKRSEE